jgi:DNA helicase-2/ATP-dependent DNA helicase PcrA
MRDPLLDDLDDAQRAAVVDPAAPLAIVAPAGSGKTRVLTRRIAYRVRESTAEPRHVLALTFTRKAAGELTDRLGALGVGEHVTAGTFHALALAQLRAHAADRRRAAPVVLDRTARLLAPLARRVARGASAGELAAEIAWARARLVAPSGYVAAARAAERAPGCPLAAVAEVYERYEQEKRRRGVLDFDDLLERCTRAIADDDDFAASQRFAFRHLFVDEFQDVSRLQLGLLEAWLGGRPDLCVVGDDAQAIYAFAGADPNLLRDFPQVFPGGTVVRLTTNYRSTPQIVRAADAVLGRGSGVDRDVPGAAGDDGPIPVLAAYADDDAEARGVVHAARDANRRGVAWSEMAVLFRTNAQAAPFEAAFARSLVPTRLRDAERPGADAALRDAIGVLRQRSREQPGATFAALLADLSAPLADEPPVLARDVFDLGRAYLAAIDGPGSVAGFAAWVELPGHADAAGPPAEAVELVTFHRAKGLEWRVVFVAGVESGLVPIAHATSGEARAEEQRLLHVALGRAGEELHVSWARRRSFAGRRVAREESPWLARIARSSTPGPADRVPDRQAALAGVRDTLRARQPPEPRRRASHR